MKPPPSATAPAPGERLIYALQAAGVAEVPMLGWYRYAQAREGLDLHSHPGAMEICFLVRGRQVYRTRQRPYVLHGGDFFVTQPDEAHDTGDQPQEKGILYWLILRLPQRGDAPFLFCPPEEAARLVSRLRALPRHFRGGPGVQRHFERLVEAAEARDEPMRRLLLYNRIVTLLLEVLEAARRNRYGEVSPRIARLLAWIDTRITETIALEELAARSRLSLSRFKTRFKEEVGIPPAEYILRRKVEKAREALATGGESITAIAFRLGFSSSQYFATVFRRYTGRSPSDFRGQSAGARRDQFRGRATRRTRAASSRRASSESSPV